MSGEGPFTHQARNQRKSVRTRARLMDAAVEVFARDGFEAASVNEIARRADVVNGTFYVHFKDKDAIAAEVAFKVAYDIARQIDGAMTHIDNAAERFSCATRQFIEIACGQPQWGWVLIRSARYAPEVHRQVESYLRTDLARGVRQGLFDLEIDAFTMDTILSMILAALAARK
ncbi:MAG: TetR/AcrR family transcriptional regulator, partial [Phenylobacterium sp.]|uniref:TetR/AcrR family transcriptional regulator n=1 Tax=Phenylobacterium sp. TaxID=1871053 RepID=UPI003015D1AC